MSHEQWECFEVTQLVAHDTSLFICLKYSVGLRVLVPVQQLVTSTSSLNTD